MAKKRSVEGPIRTCRACGRKTDKKKLLRFVVINGRLVRDYEKKAAGRGAYSCDRGSCLQKFLSDIKRLAKSFRVQICELAEELMGETQE